MIKLVSYDGDGGGLCAHMRHIYSDHRLSVLLNIEHVIAYPPFYCIFKGNFPDLSDCSAGNIIDINFFSENNYSLNEIVDFCKIKKVKYILSGGHHFSKLYAQMSSLLTSERRMMHQYFSSFRIAGEINEIISSHLPYPFKKQDYCSFHIRTFYDSLEGNQMFRDNVSGIYSLMLGMALQTDMPSYCIFSDSKKEAMYFARKLQRVINKEVDISTTATIHSSLARVLGPKILSTSVDNLEKLRLQLTLGHNTVFELIFPTLIDIISLSLSKISYTTFSSFGSMPAVLFPWSNQQDHAIVPYDSIVACEQGQPY
jgi:hypothetical protein